MKTDWKDAIFTQRKIRLEENDDGTVTPTDETEYTQEGDAFGANELNQIGAEVNRIQGMTSVTLSSSGWTGSNAPYSQVANISGVKETDIPSPGILYPSNCTRQEQNAISVAAGYISDIITGDGTVTFKCTKKPTVNITIGLKGV